MRDTGRRPRWLLHASTAAGTAVVATLVVFGAASLRDPEPGTRSAPRRPRHRPRIPDVRRELGARSARRVARPLHAIWHENVTLKVAHGAAARPGEADRAVPALDAAAERAARRVAAALAG